MSGRHAKSRHVSFNAKLAGTLTGAATAATAITLIAATPVDPAQKADAISAGTVSADSNAAIPALPERAAKAEQIRVPGKGIHHAVKGARARVPTASDALKLAVSQVGVTEDADGGGTKFQKWFVNSPWAVRGVRRDGGSISDYANANWCDMFISWIGAQLGVKGMGADAYTRTHAQWFKDQGRWGQTPKPGAVVFFSWSGGKDIDSIDHVGLVMKDDHDGTIETVEGNTDDSVEIRTRDVSSVVGYGYPEYGSGNA